jgi:hypothetical protein
MHHHGIATIGNGYALDFGPAEYASALMMIALPDDVQVHSMNKCLNYHAIAYAYQVR